MKNERVSRGHAQSLDSRFWILESGVWSLESGIIYIYIDTPVYDIYGDAKCLTNNWRGTRFSDNHIYDFLSYPGALLWQTGTPLGITKGINHGFFFLFLVAPCLASPRLLSHSWIPFLNRLEPISSIRKWWARVRVGKSTECAGWSDIDKPDLHLNWNRSVQLWVHRVEVESTTPVPDKGLHLKHK